jgi:hypothetical protein
MSDELLTQEHKKQVLGFEQGLIMLFFLLK